MPVLESTGEITPRSVLRHRPISDGDDADQQTRHPIVPPVAAPTVQRASRSRPKQTEEDEEVSEWQRVGDDEAKTNRVPVAVPRHTGVGTAPKNLPRTPRPGGIGIKRVRRVFPQRAHPLLYLGIGMIAMLTLWTLLTSAVNWWNTTMDDIHYGRPRTFQIDAVVGHNDSAENPSHFIAINLNSRIEIIEFPGGDASKARIYIGPQLYGTGEDLVPVTLSFIDVNGDHLPDMLIHFGSSQIVFINDQGGFRPLRPGEQHAVEQFLQQHGQ